MGVPCLRRLTAVHRSFLIVLFLLLGAGRALAAGIAGRVLDPDGRVVVGARVLVTTSLRSVSAATDEMGRFRIDALRAGRYDVRVMADGFTADPVMLTLGADESKEIEIALRISAFSDAIVVSAAQVEIPLSRATDTVTVIGAKDLETRQIDTVADALRLVPEMTVTRAGGRGAVTSLFPRGGGSNYTLVLVDGVRVNSFGGGYDFGHLGAANVDRIEVVRGPQSALFGSDAIGGVVQIVTRRGGRPRADGLIEGGSQGTVRTAISAAGGLGAWSWGAGVDHNRSDGFTGPAPANGQLVTNDDTRRTEVSGTLGWRQPNGPEFLLSGRTSRDDRGSPGPFGSDPAGNFGGVDTASRTHNSASQAGLQFSYPWSQRLRQRFDTNYMDLLSDFASGFGPSYSGNHRFNTRLQEDIALTSLVGASVGVEWFRERGSSTFITGTTGKPIPVRRGVTGAFAELRYADARLNVAAGARLERLSRDSVEADPTGFPPRPAFPEQTIVSANPKVSASYLLLTSAGGQASTRVHASAGTGIRPPDAFEISFTNNPDLKPERSRSVDVGVEQQLLAGRLVLGATTFFNTYDDLLVTVGASLSGASQYRTDNISNARARGLELAGDVRPLPSLTVRTRYAFVSTETLSVDGLSVAPSPFKVGDPLLRRPRHQGAVEVTHVIGPVTSFGEVTSRSEALDVEPNFGSFGGLFYNGGYTVVNLGTTVRVAPSLSLFVRGLNLFDRAYEEALGYPAPGRSGIVGLRFTASR